MIKVILSFGIMIMMPIVLFYNWLNKINKELLEYFEKEDTWGV